ncbi:hypothetical protein OJAV_G00212840 [Oryzias javanicus]|uniref:CRIB domain-containing protein n=1 Tax=Oryzias javanicus TaxID=123683 RepID=A0A3S2LMI2_ORYJA|nr:hypothetical protein OJAV_G00212840 [Oryzias javanicus]
MPLRTSTNRKSSPSHISRRISKHRETLTVNMISLPLGDFRHISHIGNNALTDSFGDLSFLKKGNGLLRHSSKSEQNLFLACVPPPKPPRLNLNLNGTEGKQSPEWSLDHRKKKCNSMPLLDGDEGDEVFKDEDCQRRNNNGLNEAHAFGLSDTSSCTDGEFTESYGDAKDEDNCFSFSLDLGPSILDDVLQVMEKIHH